LVTKSHLGDPMISGKSDYCMWVGRGLARWWWQQEPQNEHECSFGGWWWQAEPPKRAVVLAFGVGKMVVAAREYRNPENELNVLVFRVGQLVDWLTVCRIIF